MIYGFRNVHVFVSHLCHENGKTNDEFEETMKNEKKKTVTNNNNDHDEIKKSKWKKNSEKLKQHENAKDILNWRCESEQVQLSTRVALMVFMHRRYGYYLMNLKVQHDTHWTQFQL